MKLAVLNNAVPFLHGGAEHLATALTHKLVEFGHEAILVRLPFRWEPPEKILESMLACSLLRVPGVDRVIALKFPAYCIQHSDKVVWLLHQFRQAYDLWGTEFQGLPDSIEGVSIRDAIRRADQRYLAECDGIFTNSRVTSERLKQFNGIDSQVLWPPLLSTEHFHCRPAEDYVFYPSRVNGTKRQWLAVESMRHVKSPVRLVLAGKEESIADREKIDATIRRRSLSGKVTWERGFVPELRKAELMASALGVLYIPYDEDSYGYVTLEAYASRKPVISCFDSGGTDLVVKNEVTGFMVPSDPKSIAAAIDRLYADRQAARRMGEAGWQLVIDLGITWERVVRTLTQ